MKVCTVTGARTSRVTVSRPSLGLGPDGCVKVELDRSDLANLTEKASRFVVFAAVAELGTGVEQNTSEAFSVKVRI